jgi:hypothetical protein
MTSGLSSWGETASGVDFCGEKHLVLVLFEKCVECLLYGI